MLIKPLSELYKLFFSVNKHTIMLKVITVYTNSEECEGSVSNHQPLNAFRELSCLFNSLLLRRPKSENEAEEIFKKKSLAEKSAKGMLPNGFSEGRRKKKRKMILISRGCLHKYLLNTAKNPMLGRAKKNFTNF